MSKLQTNAIRHLGSSVDNITLDSSGRVLLPNQPSFAMYLNSTSYTTNQILPFGSNLHNIGNNYDVSNYKFTAPVAGTYFFYGQIRQETGAPSLSWHRIILYKNGATYDPSRGTIYTRTTGVYSSVAMTMVIKLAAGDYIQPYAEASTGSVSMATTPSETLFAGYFIG